MPWKGDKFFLVITTFIFVTKYYVLRVYDKNLLKLTKIKCHERLTNFFSLCLQSFLCQIIRIMRWDYDKNLLKWTKIKCHERLTNFFSLCRQSFLWQNIRYYEFTTRICWNEQKLNATKGWQISSRYVYNHFCDKIIRIMRLRQEFVEMNKNWMPRKADKFLLVMSTSFLWQNSITYYEFTTRICEMNKN